MQGQLSDPKVGWSFDRDETRDKSGAEEEFKPQKANAKKGSISGQMWEVDIGKEWISSRHQVIGKQVASDIEQVSRKAGSKFLEK